MSTVLAPKWVTGLSDTQLTALFEAAFGQTNGSPTTIKPLIERFPRSVHLTATKLTSPCYGFSLHDRGGMCFYRHSDGRKGIGPDFHVVAFCALIESFQIVSSEHRNTQRGAGRLSTSRKGKVDPAQRTAPRTAGDLTDDELRRLYNLAFSYGRKDTITVIPIRDTRTVSLGDANNKPMGFTLNEAGELNFVGWAGTAVFEFDVLAFTDELLRLGVIRPTHAFSLPQNPA